MAETDAVKQENNSQNSRTHNAADGRVVRRRRSLAPSQMAIWGLDCRNGVSLSLASLTSIRNPEETEGRTSQLPKMSIQFRGPPKRR